MLKMGCSMFLSQRDSKILFWFNFMHCDFTIVSSKKHALLKLVNSYHSRPA